jgi:hypothetical protein
MNSLLKLTLIAAGLFIFNSMSAQDASRTETARPTEVQPAAPASPATLPASEIPAQSKQEPVKQEEKKTAPKAESKPAPAANPAPAPSKTDSKDVPAGGTQKMAITEQGVDKTKKKQKSSQTTTTTPATPAPAEK